MAIHEISFALRRSSVYNYRAELMGIFIVRVGFQLKDGYIMASAQGICKNCGSLVMLNDKEELCECLFCDCVFPSEEALAIAQNPTEYTFPNEPQPKRDGVKRFNVTPVNLDPIPTAIKRAEVSAPPKAMEKNPYEVSPDDVKAPRKIFWGVIGVSAAFVVLTIAIAWPLQSVRMGHRAKLSESISQVFSEFSVDMKEADGYNIGYSFHGQNNNVLAVTTEEEVTKEDVLATFKNFASIRAKEYGIAEDNFSSFYGDLRLSVYASNGGFTMDIGSQEELTPDNVKELS